MVRIQPHSFVHALALLALAGADLAAVQMQDVRLISPINGKPFSALVVPMTGAARIEDDTTLADMGADDDGCRHSSGINEYDYYIATCPYSYFSALTVEWDSRDARNGRFLGEISPEIKAWVDKEFNSDRQLERENAFKLADRQAKATGKLPPEHAGFVMSQQAIPLHRKYFNALKCYEKRGARSAVLAKIALTGSWALRVGFDQPISSDQLAGGIQEINDRIARHIQDGDSFDLKKWTEVYGRIFSKPEVKTNEAILIAGLVYHGFLVRAGEHRQANAVLDRLHARFEKISQGVELLKSLVRERRESYRRYRILTDLAATKFIEAIRQEEFSRPRLPEVLLVVAESLRRSDRLADAAQWYLCLGQMPETQPKLRADIRAEGKAPSVEAPYHLQLGWIADQQLARLAELGVTVSDVPQGGYAPLLNAILFEGFGNPEFKNPAWKPIKDATQKECLMILSQVGKSVLEYKLRLGDWPSSLDDMWMRDLVRDRNLYNRFHCPVSGEELLYDRQSGEVKQRTALLCTPTAIATSQGPRYGAYLANDQVVWSEQPIKPGQVVAK